MSRWGRLQPRVLIVTAELLFLCTQEGRVCRVLRLRDVECGYWRPAEYAGARGGTGLEFALRSSDLSELPIAWCASPGDDDQWAPMLAVNNCRAPACDGAVLPLQRLQSRVGLPQQLGLTRRPPGHCDPKTKLVGWQTREHSPLRKPPPATAALGSAAAAAAGPSATPPAAAGVQPAAFQPTDDELIAGLHNDDAAAPPTGAPAPDLVLVAELQQRIDTAFRDGYEDAVRSGRAGLLSPAPVPEEPVVRKSVAPTCVRHEPEPGFSDVVSALPQFDSAHAAASPLLAHAAGHRHNCSISPRPLRGPARTLASRAAPAARRSAASRPPSAAASPRHGASAVRAALLSGLGCDAGSARASPPLPPAISAGWGGLDGRDRSLSEESLHGGLHAVFNTQARMCDTVSRLDAAPSGSMQPSPRASAHARWRCPAPARPDVLLQPLQSPTRLQHRSFQPSARVQQELQSPPRPPLSTIAPPRPESQAAFAPLPPPLPRSLPQPARPVPRPLPAAGPMSSIGQRDAGMQASMDRIRAALLEPALPAALRAASAAPSPIPSSSAVPAAAPVPAAPPSAAAQYHRL